MIGMDPIEYLGERVKETEVVLLIFFSFTKTVQRKMFLREWNWKYSIFNLSTNGEILVRFHIFAINFYNQLEKVKLKEEKVDNIKRRIAEFERDRLKRDVPADRPNPKPTHSDVDMLKSKLLRKWLSIFFPIS